MYPKMLVNGIVVSSIGRARADVLIENSKVAAVGDLNEVIPETVSRVDCSGKYIIPGGIDVHTHIDSPMMGSVTSDSFRTGTIAAATGGTTSIVDFAQQLRDSTLLESAAAHHTKAAGEAVIDYGFHMIISRLYEGFDKHMLELTQDGLSSFKVFMAYRGELMINDGQLYDVLVSLGSEHGTLCVHAENGDLIDRVANKLAEQGHTGASTHEVARPPATEVEAVSRAIAISRFAEVPLYFVHLSTAGAVEEVAKAQQTGWPIAAETCTHYLALDRTIYDMPDPQPAKAVLTPPIRSNDHQSALWRGIDTGPLSVVSSDHCPFCVKDKIAVGGTDFRKMPNGGPGVEDRMLILYDRGVVSGRISMEKFVEVTSLNPAKQFGLYPMKGHLSAGADADLVVLDPSGTTHMGVKYQNQNVDYSLYEGETIPCAIERVYSRGELIVQDRRYVGGPGRGRFIQR
jgi:dihydropyrimidinase